VTVIDGANNFATTPVPLGGTYPYTLAVDQVTNKIYVATYDMTGSSDDSSAVTVIDGATNATTIVPAWEMETIFQFRR
jgi:DNA-binding beta-propeller fold protein YncE